MKPQPAPAIFAPLGPPRRKSKAGII